MNDELIKKLIEYMESSKNFILEQAPDLIQQMLKYETISAILTISIFIFIFLLSLGFTLYSFLYVKKESLLHSMGIVPLMLLPFLIGGLIFSIDNLIKIKVAPKYYIIQKLKEKK